MAATLFGDDVSIQENSSRFETVGSVGRMEWSNSRDSSWKGYDDDHFEASINAQWSHEPAGEDDGAEFGQGIWD